MDCTKGLDKNFEFIFNAKQVGLQSRSWERAATHLISKSLGPSFFFFLYSFSSGRFKTKNDFLWNFYDWNDILFSQNRMVKKTTLTNGFLNFENYFVVYCKKCEKYQLHSSKPNVSISAYQLTLLMQTQRFIFYKNVIKIETISPFVIQFNGIAIKNCDKCWRFFPSPK